MSKHYLKRLSSVLLAIKPQYLLMAVLVSLVVCVLSLRANNQKMVELRQAVYSADEKGAGVAPALQALQAFVTRHMNTNLQTGNTGVYPPIQLKNTYERLLKARGDALSQSNATTYADAQKYCEQQNPTAFYGASRIGCIEQYVQGHGGDSTLPAPIDGALYKFDFVSPSWSPDLAGWSLVATILLALYTAMALVWHFARRRKQ